MIHVKFEDWLKRSETIKLKAELEESFDIQECPECNGSGECECSCGDVHFCGYCGGSGKDGDVDDELKRIYERECKKDEEEFEKYKNLVAA